MRFRIWDKVKEEFTKDRIFIDNTGKIYKIKKENKILDIDSKFCILNFSIEHRDKNNKEIFEGDIIKYGEKYFQIIYRKEISSWSINFSKKDNSRPCTNVGILKKCEIVGNIYENKELLKLCTDNLFEKDKSIEWQKAGIKGNS